MTRTLPILCAAPVVRNILSGAQTQDRRPLRPQPNADWIGLGCLWYPGGPEAPRSLAYDGEAHFRKGAPKDFAPWKVGDTLYVRETWRAWCPDGPEWRVRYAADGGTLDPDCRWDEGANYEPAPDVEPDRWRPSIHMPKWAARIHLRIAAVRVERVGEISEADARAEGCADVEDFARLWIKLYGIWSDNPWVWVTTFERVML